MRVLLVFEPPDGGVPEVVLRLALGIGAHGVDVEVAGPAAAMPYSELQAAGIPVHRLPFERGYRTPARDGRATRALAARIRSGRFDAVHCHSAKAGALGRVAARLAGVPALYSPHCLAFEGDVARRRAAFALAARDAWARSPPRCSASASMSAAWPSVTAWSRLSGCGWSTTERLRCHSPVRWTPGSSTFAGPAYWPARCACCATRKGCTTSSRQRRPCWRPCRKHASPSSATGPWLDLWTRAQPRSGSTATCASRASTSWGRPPSTCARSMSSCCRRCGRRCRSRCSRRWRAACRRSQQRWPGRRRPSPRRRAGSCRRATPARSRRR